jgi:hypothetical protein
VVAQPGAKVLDMNATRALSAPPVEHPVAVQEDHNSCNVACRPLNTTDAVGMEDDFF